jgi:hypothetical protein
MPCVIIDIMKNINRWKKTKIYLRNTQHERKFDGGEHT